MPRPLRRSSYTASRWRTSCVRAAAMPARRASTSSYAARVERAEAEAARFPATLGRRQEIVGLLQVLKLLGCPVLQLLLVASGRDAKSAPFRDKRLDILVSSVLIQSQGTQCFQTVHDTSLISSTTSYPTKAAPFRNLRAKKCRPVSGPANNLKWWRLGDRTPDLRLAKPALSQLS